MKIKVPKIVDEAEEQPTHSSDDTDAEVSGRMSEGKTKMMGQAGLPHKHGEKMPHEHFQDKMSDKLGC